MPTFLTSHPVKSFDDQLISLYIEQAKLNTNEYLEAHSHNRAVIRRDTSIFERYSKHIPESGTVLDWGCNHAPTSCLVKMLRGNAIEMHGCDIHTNVYESFYDFSGLTYERLKHPYLLPYDDDSFDAVIGTAALEHVPNDGESLTELYRVIKPGGVFIMTTLPNRLSYTEFLNRNFSNGGHKRIYGLKEAKSMFLHHGFLPIESGYHQVLPSLCSASLKSPTMNALVDLIASQNSILERLWPVRCFASNIFVIGRKVGGL